MDVDNIRQVVRRFYETNPQSAHFTICCISAFVGETITYPLDIVKTRLQVIGQLSPTTNRPDLLKLVISIAKYEGILSFWQGLSPALYRHFLYTGARMPIYEVIRNNVFSMPPASVGARKHSSFEIRQVCNKSKDSGVLADGYFWRAAAGGVISGALAQFISSPTDLLKVRLQTEVRKSLAATAASAGPGSPSPSSFRAPKMSPKVSFTMRQLVKEAGFFGLWRGGLPNVQRAALVNMGEMTTYDTAKRWLQQRFNFQDGPLLHGCASTMSGFVSAILGTPADLIKTRMMNQRLMTATGTTLPPLYSGMIDCAAKVVKQEGFFTLYRGFFLIWGRMAPWSLTFWLSYEKLRTFVGAGGF